MKRLKSIIVAAVADRERAGVDDPSYRTQLSFFGGARGLGAAVAPGKFFHATRSVDEFLFASEKWMTSGTNTDFNIATRRAGVIHRAARAHNISLVILWMNVCFHLQKGARNLIARSGSRKG
jgi:hypothetical protein